MRDEKRAPKDSRTYWREREEEAQLQYERLAGILGKTVVNNAEHVRQIVRGSFRGKDFATAEGKRWPTFSETIWKHQDDLSDNLSRLLSSFIISGRGSRKVARELDKLFKVGEYNALRLMRTETQRVQTEVAKDSMIANGNTHYEFLATGANPCDICEGLDGEVFPISEMQVGKNAPPMHPNCHCTIAPRWDEEKYQRWIDSGAAEAGVGYNEFAAEDVKQSYRPVRRLESSTFSASLSPIVANEIGGYGGKVFVSEKASIKPRALHQINQNTLDALKEWGVTMERPIMVVADPSELHGLGLYDAKTNTVYYASDITDASVMKNNGGLKHTEFHEMWHVRQAELYKEKGGDPAAVSDYQYLKSVSTASKKRLDLVEVDTHNIESISEYAARSYDKGRYDEAEAEYMAYRKKR